MIRREFLKNTSLSTLAVLTAKSSFAGLAISELNKQKLFVGAHVWIYASKQANYDVSPILKTIFSEMAYAGFDGVETMEQPLRSETYTKQIGELKEQFKIALLGTSYGADMWDKNKHNEIYEDVDLIMSNLAKVGGRTFGTSVGKPSGRIKTEVELDNQAELLKKLVVLGKKNNVVLNLHNHTYEVENEMHDLGGTLKRIPDIKLGPDLNWLLRAGVNPIEFIKKYKEQLCFIHIRDQYSNGKWPESLGEGDVDYKEFGKTVRDIGFSGDVVIELAHESNFELSRPVQESLKMSRDYLRKVAKI